MSTISAGTTSGTALVSTGDTSGNLVLQVNGTTTSVTLNTSGAIGVGSSPSYGSSGQVLTSGGSSAVPTWTTPSAGALVFLNTNSLSGTSSYTITSGFSSTYDDYFFIVSNIVCTGTNTLSFRFYKSGSTQTSGYSSRFGAFAGSTTTSTDSTGVPFGGVNTSGILAGYGYLMNANSTSANAANLITNFSANDPSNSANNRLTISSGSQSTAAAVTGLTFFSIASENFSATFKLYGIAKS